MSPTKFLIVGIIFAALVFGGGHALTWYFEMKLSDAVAKCEADSRSNAVPVEERGKAVCDPKLLAILNEDAKDLGEIANLDHQKRDTAEWTIGITAALVLFSTLPWTWYFLLRRIRELRDSVAGQ
jgi:hypothetical protein